MERTEGRLSSEGGRGMLSPVGRTRSVPQEEGELGAKEPRAQSNITIYSSELWYTHIL